MKTSTKIKLTKSVLVFSFIVIGIISAYTTIIIFSSPDLNLQLSPNQLPEYFNETNETNETGISFDIEQEFPDNFEQAPDNSEKKVFKSGTIPPADPSIQTNPGPIDFLITFEDIEPEQSMKIIFMIILEILVIYLVYRQLDFRLGEKLSS